MLLSLTHYHHQVQVLAMFLRTNGYYYCQVASSFWRIGAATSSQRRLFRPWPCLAVQRAKMSAQVTDRVLMVRPGRFASNPDTAGDNAFQTPQQAHQAQEIEQAALKEFQALADLLRREGVEVEVRDDTLNLPDAIFPNNWISFHGPSTRSGTKSSHLTLYPMMSVLRRKERRPDLVQSLAEMLGAKIQDYSQYENQDMFLEGTGSMVLDRTNAVIYACLSQRTHPTLLELNSRDLGYELVSFKAKSKLPDGSLAPIYHTNVMMSVGTTFAVVCLDSITDKMEREEVCVKLRNCGKEVVDITTQQMSDFAGNVLQLRSRDGDSLLVMSTRAYQSLSQKQLSTFKQHSCSVVHSDLTTVETYGGGGARCMIAEIFPPLDDDSQ